MSQSEEENLALAAKLASINILFAQKELGKRITDPTITTKGLLDIAEHSYKVSGMAKKQEVKEDQTVVIFNIAPPGGTPISIEKVVGGETLDMDSPNALATQANVLVSGDSHDEWPEEAWV